MDLQDFVTTTLCQISAGVATAKNYDRSIAPRIGVGQDDPKILRTLADSDGVFLVEFDVPITASETTKNGAAVAITVLSLASGKGQAKRSTENSLVSRVKFSVPINYR
jgi:hypothetical protein